MKPVDFFANHSVFRFEEFAAAHREGADCKPAASLDALKQHVRAGHLFRVRSEEHTSELQYRQSITYAVFCVKKKTTPKTSGRQDPQERPIPFHCRRHDYQVFGP